MEGVEPEADPPRVHLVRDYENERALYEGRPDRAVFDAGRGGRAVARPYLGPWGTDAPRVGAPR